jgi:hypothetical protein
LPPGHEPENYDKEFIRIAYADQVTAATVHTAMPSSLWAAASQRYISIYERSPGRIHSRRNRVAPRLRSNLERRACYEDAPDRHF